MQKLINLKMIDCAQYKRERKAANKRLIFGIRIDLEGSPISSVNSGYLIYCNLLTFSLKRLSRKRLKEKRGYSDI
jgi:hypothetical protein